MIKKWEVNKTDTEEAEEFAKKYKISNLLSSILIHRGITTDTDVSKFLHPTRMDFYDPFLMPDMDKAVNRIMEAVRNKEKITIYGDYDVDGITSITVLKNFFADSYIDVMTYIPNRLDEGYGLNKDAIREISYYDTNLIITVDCGITGIEEIEYAKKLGIDVIVTDHHEPGEELPNCIAVVDAKRKDNTYPFNQLAGCGVAFKLIQALATKWKIPENEYLKYLDIVAVGTISDIVPLVDENRVIAKLGLMLLPQTKNIGLKALMDLCGFKKIDSNMVSFGLSPRINACGRMGHAEEALNLFLAKDSKKTGSMAKKLNEYNVERQKIEKNIYDEAIEEIEKEKENPAIVIGKENWHHGVAGIVSSKITEEYFKPSILVCFEGEEGKGSGRSIPGFDLHEALMECSEYLEKFGGHSMAVGITIRKEKFEDFKKAFIEYTKSKNISGIVPVINIESKIELKDINLKNVKDLQRLEPFGEKNKTPLFLIENLKIVSIRALSEGKHLKILLKQDNFFIDAIGFNIGDLANEYKIEDKVDIVGTIDINVFNGNENIQLTIKDIRKSI